MTGVGVPVTLVVSSVAIVPVDLKVRPTSVGPLPDLIARKGRAPAEWTLVLCDQAGFEVLEVAAEPRFTFTRNRHPEVEFTVDVGDEAAVRTVSILANGLPRLRAYRRGDQAQSLLRFYGSWAPMQEEASGDADDNATMMFRGPGAMLEKRWTAPTRTFTAVDQGQILTGLLADTNAEAQTGITAGTIEATVARDRTYENKNVSEAFVEMTEVIGGPDFDITPIYDEQNPDPATIGALNVYARQGQDLSGRVVFEFGFETTGTVSRVRRSLLLPVNKVRVLGANNLVGEASDLASIAKYGLHMDRIDATDVSLQATLVGKAQAALRPEPVRVLEFDPDPDTAPRPFDDFWVGDTITLRIRHGSLLEDLAVRVNQIVITPDDTGREDFTVAVEAPEAAGPLRLPPDARGPYTTLRRDLRATAQRIHALP